MAVRLLRRKIFADYDEACRHEQECKREHMAKDKIRKTASAGSAQSAPIETTKIGRVEPDAIQHHQCLVGTCSSGEDRGEFAFVTRSDNRETGDPAKHVRNRARLSIIDFIPGDDRDRGRCVVDLGFDPGRGDRDLVAEGGFGRSVGRVGLCKCCRNADHKHKN